MAIYEVVGPDRRKYEIEGPAGASKEDVLQILAQHLEQNPPAPPRGGFGPAFKSGIASLQAGATELGEQLGLLDPAKAAEQRADLEGFQQRTFAPESKGWMETPGKAFAETLGGSIPFMLAPVAAGVAGGPGALGLGLAGLTSGAQFTGTNLSRQRDAGQPLSLPGAATAAVPQAALDLIGFRFIPGLRQIFGAAGKEITEQAAGQVARKALADYFVSAGKAATAEGATEALQQVLERAQAGLSISDPAAREEYLESAIGGAVLGGTVAVPGRAIERGAEARKREEEQKKERDARNAQLRQQQAQEQAAEEERRKSPSYASEISQKWQAMELQREKLETARKTVPAGPSAGDERSRLTQELKELTQSDEYKALREEFKKVHPLVQQMKRAGEQMAPPPGGLAGRLEANRDPLAGRGFTEPAQPSTASQPIGEVIARLQANPQAAERVINREITIPGLSASDNRAVIDTLLTLREQQKRQQDNAFITDANQQAENLRELPGNFAPDDGSFIEPPTGPLTRNIGVTREDGSKRPPNRRGEVEVDPDTVPNPYLDNVFDRALNPPRDDIVPPAAGVQPQGRASFDVIDRLYDDLEKGDTNRIDRREPHDVQRENAANQARARLDQIKGQEGGHHKMVVDVRDRQRAAVDEMLQALDELRSGQVLGQADKTPEAGKFKGPKHQPKQVPGAPDFVEDTPEGAPDGQTPLFHPEQSGGAGAKVLADRVERARAEYIRAAVEEANIRRTAEGRALSNDEAIKLADGLNTRLEEVITRLQAKGLKEIGWDGQPDEKPKVDPRGATTTKYTIADPDGAGPVKLSIKRDKFGKVVRFDGFFPQTGARMDLLKTQEQDAQGKMHDVRESYGPGMTDAMLVQQLLDAGFAPGTQDKRPLEQRPFRRPGAALEVAKEDIRQFTREGVAPKRGGATVDKPLLREQFPASEAKRFDEERSNPRRRAEAALDTTNRALARPDLPFGLKRTLEQNRNALDAGSATPDMVDAAQELADRALRGERVREHATMRDLDDAKKTAADAATDDSGPEQLDLFSFSQHKAWPVNANTPQINKIKKQIREAKEADEQLRGRLALRARARQLHDDLVRRIEALRVKLESFDWMRLASKPLPDKQLAELTPLNAQMRQMATLGLGPGWVQEYDKLVEVQKEAIAELRSFMEKDSKEKAGFAARVAKESRPIKDRIAVLERQAAALNDRIFKLSDVDTSAQAQKAVEDKRGARVAQLQAAMREAMDNVAKARSEVIGRLTEEGRAQLKPEGDKLNEALLRVQQGLEAWKPARTKLRTANTKHPGNAETEFELKIAEDTVAKLEAEDATIRARMEHLEQLAVEGFDSQVMTLIAYEDAGVRNLYKKYAQLERALEVQQSEGSITPNDATRARRQAATMLAEARKKSEAATREIEHWRERYLNSLKGFMRSMKMPGEATVSRQLGMALPGQRRDVAGPANDRVIAVKHSDGTTEKIKVPAWEQSRALIDAVDTEIIDKHLEIKDAEGNVVELLPIAAIKTDTGLNWREGAKIVAENYERLFNEAREQALARPQLAPGKTKPERADTRAVGPASRDKYAGGPKRIEEARKPVQKGDPFFGMSDAEVAEAIKKDKKNFTELETKRIQLDTELSDLAQRRLKLNERIERERSGGANEQVVSKLINDARKLEIELFGKTREVHDLERTLTPLRNRVMRERSEAADAKMENQRLAKATPDKFGQGDVRVVDKKAAKARRQKKASLLTNLKNASEALAKENEERIEEDDDAFRTMFGNGDFGPDTFESTRREFIIGGAAMLANAQVRADTTLGKAQPISAEILTQKVNSEVEALLRSANSGDGAAALKKALGQIVATGPKELRALATMIGRLLPSSGIELRVDDARKMNAHGAVELGRGAPRMTLFTAEGRTGLSYATVLHEAAHVAVAARYRSLSMGVLRSNDAKLGMAAPKAAEALEQFKKVWMEFKDAAEGFPTTGELGVSLKEAAGDPDEFFVRALTDPLLQRWMAGQEYKGKTLWERFKDWVKKGLFGLSNLESLKTGTKPSWLDAALVAANDLTAAMEADAADFARANKVRDVLGNRSEFRSARAIPSVVFAPEPTIGENLKGNLTGLGFRVQMVDGMAAVAKAIDLGKDAAKLDEWQAFAAHYFMRFANQVTQFGGQVLTRGPLKIVTENFGSHTEARYEAQDGANMKSIADKVGDAAKTAGWSPAEAERIFSWMAVGARANATPRGWERLHSADLSGSKKLAQSTKVNPAEAKAEYRQWMDVLDQNPAAKALMEDAMREYKEFNDGLIDFNVQAGSISKELAKTLKATPYAPFYRVVNGDVKLFVDSETSLTIGNIKDQPDLQEMVGGHQQLFDIFQSATMNAFMLTRMGLRNKATAETVNALHKTGVISRMSNKAGPAGRNVVHYKVNGENHWAIIDTDFGGVPADLIVKGMEGIRTMIPAWVRMMGVPADILRKSITRSPAYLLRQLVRDPTHAVIGGAVDGIPVFNALNEIRKEWTGGNPAMEALQRGGAVSSNIFTGDSRDFTRYAREIAVGKSGTRKLFHFLDMRALEADTATRAAVYNDSIRKGMTPAQAQFRALEIQNFSRRGLSPGMQVLSTIIPFFNAQVQGLDVLYRTFKGDVPFAQQLEIRKKLAERATLLVLTSLAYTAAMMDDEDYRKARPEERYQNFFVPNPFGEDWIKVPIPFELGVLFKALPEAMLDYAMTDTTSGELAKGLFRVARTSLPDVSKGPTAVAPIIQYMYNSTGFGPIETTREQQLIPSERWREKTSELAKLMGRLTGDAGISPLALEHFVRGYLGPLGIAAMHIPNALLREDGFEPASKGAADNPVLGSVFQRREGRHLMDRAYDRWDEIVTAQRTYKNMAENGRRAEAERFRQDKANELAMAEVAGLFRQQAGALMAAERRIRAHPTMPQAEKDRRIGLIREKQNQIARAFFGQTTRQ